MQILRTLSLSLLLSAALVSTASTPQVNPASTVKFSETPAKTIFLKHPGANDAATFFATSTTFNFEVFKPGTKAEMTKIIAVLKAESGVDNALEGTVTGDFHAINLTLKSAKDKMWFIALFKKAGLNTIKINTNPIVEVEKM